MSKDGKGGNQDSLLDQIREDVDAIYNPKGGSNPPVPPTSPPKK